MVSPDVPCPAVEAVEGESVSEHPVEDPVAGGEGGFADVGDLPRCVLDDLGGDVGVEPPECLFEPGEEDHVLIGGSLGEKFSGCNLRSGTVLVPEVLEPLQADLLDYVLHDQVSCHVSTTSRNFSASSTRISPDMSLGRRVSRREERVPFSL